MTPTLEQLVREIIPLLGTTWVDNYEAKQDWIKQAEAALTPEPPAPGALPPPPEDVYPYPYPIVWPEYPKVCKCGNFVGTLGDSFRCANCGGLLF